MTKIIISLTTIKKRLSLLKQTMISLINQTQKPDAIHIFYSNESFLLDEGITDEEIKQLLFDIKIVDYNQNNIIFTSVKNIGPYRKLINALKIYNDAIIITVDDDIYYNNKMIHTYISAYNKYKCIICSKYRTIDFSTNSLLTNYYFNEETKCMQILPEGFGGILYHTNMFNNDIIEFNYLDLDDVSIKNDDIFFRLYTFYNNIPIVAVNINLNEIIKYNTESLYNTNINIDFGYRISLIKQYDIIKKYMINLINNSYTMNKYLSKNDGFDVKILQYEQFAKNIDNSQIDLIYILQNKFEKNLKTNIIVINLEKDTHRLKSFNNEIQKINIQTYIHLKATYWKQKQMFQDDMNGIFTNLKKFVKINVDQLHMNETSFWNDTNIHIQDGPLACYCSHLRAMIYAYLNFEDYVIICEDDIYISNTGNIAKYLEEIPNDFDIITLGSIPIQCKYDEPCYEYKSLFHSTHFYIINLKCMPFLLSQLYPIDDQIDILIARLHDKLNIYNITDCVYQKNFSTNTQNNIHTIFTSDGYANIREAIENFKQLLFNIIKNKQSNNKYINNIVENIMHDVVYSCILNNIYSDKILNIQNNNNNIELFDLLYYILVCCIKGVNITDLTNKLLDDIMHIIDNFTLNCQYLNYGSTSNIFLENNVIYKKYNKTLRWHHLNHDINMIFNKERFILSLFNDVHLPKLYDSTDDTLIMDYLGVSLYDNFNLPSDWQTQINYIFTKLSSHHIIYNEFNLKNIMCLNNVIAFVDFGLAEISEYAYNINMQNCDVFIEILTKIQTNINDKPKNMYKTLFMNQINYYKNNDMYTSNIY